jgi:hypothetical protein
METSHATPAYARNEVKARPPLCQADVEGRVAGVARPLRRHGTGCVCPSPRSIVVRYFGRYRIGLTRDGAESRGKDAGTIAPLSSEEFKDAKV